MDFNSLHTKNIVNHIWHKDTHKWQRKNHVPFITHTNAISRKNDSVLMFINRIKSFLQENEMATVITST